MVVKSLPGRSLLRQECIVLHVTDVTYDTRERVSTISYPDPDGAGILPRPIDVMIYDKNSNLLRRRNPDSTFVGELRYKYDAENRLAGRSHSEYVFDNATTGEDLSTYETHEYDRIGRISKINRVGRDRPSSPLVLAEIGQTTPYVLYSYDSVGRVASEVHLSQAGEVLYQLTYTYSAAGELISRADGQGNVSRNVYDARGYKIQETNADPDGAGPQFPLVNRYAYDALGRLISMDRSFGRVTSVEYNSRNWPTKWTEPDPDGNGPLTSPVTQIGYNVRGDQTHTISPMGRITYFGYDEEQRQVYQVEPDPDGTGPLGAPVRSWAFNGADWLVAESDPRGAATFYIYDALGRPTSIVAPDPDDSGPQTTPISTLTYDERGLIRVTDALNRSTSYGLDKAGRRTSLTDTANQLTQYAHNFYDQILSIKSPDPDAVGPLGNPITRFEYDQQGRLSSKRETTEPFDNVTNSVTRFSYDTNSNLRTVTDANQNITSYAYDGLNRVKSETTKRVATGASSATDVTREYVYDVSGNLTRTKDRNGRVIQYVYDNLDRQIQERWGDAIQLNPAVTITTDVNGQQQNEQQTVGWNAFGLTSLSGSFLLQFGGHFTSAIPWNASSATIQSALEALPSIGAGNIVANVTQPNTYSRSIQLTFRNARGGSNAQFTVTFGSPNIGVDMQTLRVDAANLSGGFVQTITSTYNSESELTSVTDPSATINFTRDNLGRATTIQNILGSFAATHFTFHQGFDSVGNRTELRGVHGTSNDFRNTYTYDKLRRMTEVTQTSQPGGSAVLPKRVALEYNALGQRKKISRFESTGTTNAVATTDFTYDFANRLSSIAHKKGTTNLNTHSYTYDPLSRLRSITSTLDGTINYTYDQRSQLTIADDGQPYSPGHPTLLGERYQYDANGTARELASQFWQTIGSRLHRVRRIRMTTKAMSSA
jgi:YD repeat-containing protein